MSFETGDTVVLTLGQEYEDEGIVCTYLRARNDGLHVLEPHEEVKELLPFDGNLHLFPRDFEKVKKNDLFSPL